MQDLLKTYQKRLTNLSSRNKSLLLMRTSKNYFFDFRELDFSVNKSAYELLSSVLFKKGKTSIARILDARDEKANELSKSLNSLYRSDQLIQAERGATDLQVGFPFVKGKLSNGSNVRCPLLFFPVSLEKGDKAWSLQVTGEVQFNSSFLLAYQQFNVIELEETLLEEDFSEAPSEMEAFILYLYNYLKDSRLEINFNRDLFEKQVESFENLIKEDLENLALGELKLQPQAVLGIFPQSGSYIAQDYVELLQSTEEKSLEERFTPESIEVVKEKHLNLPLPVDASQEAVIKSIHEGKSMVVQGPPGSGKSQLIANLMADYAAKGKKALLVCQKRAALDTVYKRLSSIDLAPFVGLVHDFKSDRKPLYKQIEDQIDAIETYKKDNYELDAIFLEREFKRVSLEIEKLCKQLDQFKTALYDEALLGISPKQLYLNLSESKLRQAASMAITQGFESYDHNSLQAFLPKVSKLSAFDEALKGVAKAFWDNRKNSANWGRSDFENLMRQFQGLEESKSSFEKWELVEESSFNSRFHIAEKANAFLALKSNHEILFSTKSHEEVSSLRDGLKTFADQEEVFTAIQKKEFRVIKRAFDKAKVVTSNKLKFQWFKWTSSDWKVLEPWLADKSLEAFEEELKAFQRFCELQSLFGFKTLKEAEVILKVQLVAQSLQKELKSIGIENLNDFQSFSKVLSESQAISTQLETYFELFDFELFYRIGSTVVSDYLNEHEDNIQANDEVVASLSNAEADLLSISLDKCCIEKSILESFVSRVEKKEPILKSVSSLKMEQMEADLQALIVKKQELSQRNLLIQLKESTYRFVDKNRLGNTTTYRELRHQVTKKRRVWPIRKVLASFHDDLFKLTPCWMASPETVSAIFRMEAYFDVVIFDEASQCYAEQGLPAMLRGKQALVAGDDMQLQPTDLYNIRYEAVDEENYLTEIDSLLQLSQTFLPSRMLHGHYRSKTLPLIQFSNTHFYKGKLQLVPDFTEANSQSIPIIYENVKGTWGQNQNQIEAERVSELLKELRSKSPEKTIGIVTFNYPQAKLIRDLVPDEKVDIKNIENIQGDEYDIVVFSMAYAQDVKGKMRFQFGSLSQAGGENRLNVAVTRAKEKIYLICSIEPDDLKVDHVSNQGPKLLKAYLQYAKQVSDGGVKEVSQKENGTISHSLAIKLQKENTSLSDELPFVELVEKEGNQYGEAFLTDDRIFFQALSAKEAFAYIPLTLKNKSWTVSRKWSRNYWKKSN